MKQITINIDNPAIETALLSLSKMQNKSIETIAADIIKQVVEMIKADKQPEFKYDTLDPEKFMHKINYHLKEDVEMGAASPFGHISDSSEYIKTLRKNTWRR
jgi:tRNA A58 N-methylase Trm61